MFTGRTSAVLLTTIPPSRRKGIVECGVRAMSLFAAKPARRRFARPIAGRAERHARWNALMANAPEALEPALGARFRETGRTARVEAMQGDSVQVALSLASVSAAVPTTNFARTPDGAIGLRQATPAETAEWYRQYVASQILLVVEECFAAGPMLAGVKVVASYDGQPLVADPDRTPHHPASGVLRPTAGRERRRDGCRRCRDRGLGRPGARRRSPRRRR
jgi:hypothetical protein